MSFNLYTIDEFSDERGELVAFDYLGESFFLPKRVYLISNVPKNSTRGFHSHNTLKQLIICTSGRFEFKLHDGKGWHTYELSKSNQVLYVDKPAWREFKALEQGSSLLVLASEHYDREDYEFSFDSFVKNVNSIKKGNV